MPRANARRHSGPRCSADDKLTGATSEQRESSKVASEEVADTENGRSREDRWRVDAQELDAAPTHSGFRERVATCENAVFSEEVALAPEDAGQGVPLQSGEAGEAWNQAVKLAFTEEPSDGKLAAIDWAKRMTSGQPPLGEEEIRQAQLESERLKAVNKTLKEGLLAFVSGRLDLEADSTGVDKDIMRMRRRLVALKALVAGAPADVPLDHGQTGHDDAAGLPRDRERETCLGETGCGAAVASRGGANDTVALGSPRTAPPTVSWSQALALVNETAALSSPRTPQPTVSSSQALAAVLKANAIRSPDGSKAGHIKTRRLSARHFAAYRDAARCGQQYALAS